MGAESLPWSINLLTLVLIAQAVFLLEQGQTDRQTDKVTDTTDHSTKRLYLLHRVTLEPLSLRDAAKTSRKLSRC